MKFRRKGTAAQSATEEQTGEQADPTAGPWDIAEAPGGVDGHVDLGALLVPRMEGRELRLQVDESTNAVRGVLLATPEGAVEFQAYAAPRNGDLWSTVRPQIAEDVARRGGKSSEREGRWGVELMCEVPVQLPDGTQGIQPSRIVGVNGGRWLLRATFMGIPAMKPEESGDWEDALAQVVVRRGEEARPVGEQLPVTLPADARRVG